MMRLNTEELADATSMRVRFGGRHAVKSIPSGGRVPFDEIPEELQGAIQRGYIHAFHPAVLRSHRKARSTVDSQGGKKWGAEGQRCTTERQAGSGW